MKKWIISLSTFAMVACVHATVVAYDGFASQDTAQNSAGSAAGVYEAGNDLRDAWYNSKTHGGTMVNFENAADKIWTGNSGLIDVSSSGLTHSSFAGTEQDGAVLYTGATSASDRNAYRQMVAAPSATTLYLGGMVSADQFGTDSTWLNGSLMGFSDGTFNRNNSTHGIRWGFSGNDLVLHGGGNGSSTSNIKLVDGASVDTTYFVVAKVEFNAVGNETVSVWVNPDASEAEGTADLVVTSRDYADSLSDFRFASFDTREDAGAAVTMDELTMGTTWNDIVAVPEPATLGFVTAFGTCVIFIRRLFLI